MALLKKDIIAGEKMITLAFKCASNHFWLTGMFEITRIFSTWEFAGVQHRIQDLGTWWKTNPCKYVLQIKIWDSTSFSDFTAVLFQKKLKKLKLLIVTTSWTHQKCTKHIKTDKVNDGKIAPTRVFFPWIIIRFGITAFSRQTCQHDFLPGFSSCTPL